MRLTPSPGGALGIRCRASIELFVLATLCVPFGLAIAAEARNTLPPPTGSLPVGRTTYYWTDVSRPETNTPAEHDQRELRVDLWYPAATTAAAAAPYCSDLAVLGKSLGVEVVLIRPLKTHSFDNPPMAAGSEKYPVILLSPAMGTNGFQYTALVEELVSHGYVVATLDHPFQSRAIAYPDGRIVVVAGDSENVAVNPEQALARYRAKVEPRAADLRFVLEQLERLNASMGDSPFAGRLDLSRAATVGHSIGGVAAVEACIDDPRFKAAANLDGHAASLPFLADAQGGGPKQPLIELTDGPFHPTDEDLAKRNMTREEFDRTLAEQAVRIDAAMRTIAGGSYRVTIRGVRHQSFSDAMAWDKGTEAERHRRFQIIRDYVRAFFDRHVRDQQAPLLELPKSPHTEVTVERFAHP